MAQNLSTMQASITDWLAIDTVRLPNTTSAQIINLTLRKLARQLDMNEMEVAGTLTTVANQQLYSLTTLFPNFSRPHTLWYINNVGTASQIIIVLKELSKEAFDPLFPNPNPPGITPPILPNAYTIFARQIWLGPVPASVQVINFNYYQYLPDLVAATDTNDVLLNYWDYVLVRSLEFASKYVLEDQRVPIFKEEADKLLNDLIITDVRRMQGARPISSEPGSVSPNQGQQL